MSCLSCTVCYDQYYSQITTRPDILSCRQAALALGNDGWVAMGSKTSSDATSFDVLAFIPARQVIIASAGTSQVALGPYNGVYFYWLLYKSLGFASSNAIECNQPQGDYGVDVLMTDCSSRLSWRVDAPVNPSFFRETSPSSPTNAPFNLICAGSPGSRKEPAFAPGLLST